MPSSRRPPRTIASSVGVAGAVLASVVVTFALASSLVAYNLTSVDPVPRPSRPLVLAPVGARVTTAKPLVLRPARATTAQQAAAPAAVVRPVAVAKPAGDGAAVALRRRGTRATPKPQDAGDTTIAPAKPASDPPAPQPLLSPVGETVGATGQAVGATTDALGRRLDTVTAAAGDALRTTADRSGRVVGRLLGGSPAR